MKQAYTQYKCLLTVNSKINGMSPSEYLTSIEYSEGMGLNTPHVSSEYIELLRAEYDVLSGNGYHVYLQQKDFCDWLAEEANTSNIMPVEYLFDDIACGAPLVFHFSVKSCLPSFLATCRHNYLSTTTGKAPQHDIVCTPWNHNTDDSYTSKLVNGLGMYLKCFPECIISGVPEDLKHPSYHKSSNSYSIQLSPCIRPHNGTHASPCGHFRQGHFRVLQSEWYKKKRHQVLFIDETFVNGKAHTVLSPEEVDSSSSSSTSIA